MKLKKYFMLLACSTALSASAADLLIDNGTPVTIDAATNANTLYIGRYFDDNELTITNGGNVTAENGFVGQNSANNSVLITGTDAVLQLTESLKIGPDGAHNSLVIEDGGQVLIGTTNGVADAISVGNTNGTASLTLANGASVNATSLIVGTASDESGRVTLSGSGTEITLTDSVFIGTDGSSSNTVTLSSGSTLTVSNLLQVGSASASNNVLNIQSGGKAVVGNATVNNSEENKININGTLTFLGDATLDDPIAQGFNFASGSTLEVGGTLQLDSQLDKGMKVILNDNLNTNLTANWNTGDSELYVGHVVNNNALVIQDGAEVIAGGATAHIGEYSNNNSVTIKGTNSTFTVDGQLLVGMKGSNNTLTLADGGSAVITNDLRVGQLAAASSNSVTIENASLAIGGDAVIGQAGTKSGLKMTDGTLTVGGDLAFGKNSDSNTGLITGSNAIATVGGNLLVGMTHKNNKLEIENGATLTVTGDALIGTNGTENTIMVTGTNSLMDINGFLTLGNLTTTNDHTANLLGAFDTGRIDIGGDLNIGNGSSVRIEAGSKITVGGDYHQDETSSLEISLSTNNLLGVVNMAVAGEAHFATNSTITVFDGGIKTNTFEQVAVSSTGLFIGGTSATTAMLNDTNTIRLVNHLLNINAVVTNESIVLKTERFSIAETSGLEGTELKALADEIDAMALAGSTNAVTLRNILGIDLDTNKERNAVMNDYYGRKGSSAPMHNLVNSGLAGFASKLTTRGDTTRERVTTQPTGPAGPYAAEQELQGWISGFGSWGSHDGGGGFGGYDSDLKGMVLGVDLSIANNVLFGLAGGTASGHVDKDNGGKGDSKTTFGALYASLGTKAWFLNSSILYGDSQIDQRLGKILDTTADYDAQNIAFYIGGGKEITGQYLIITPEASLLFNHYKQDAYNEKSTMAPPREVSGFDTLYIQSSIGCTVAFYSALGTMDIKPELRAHWLHEFNADDETLRTRLAGGTGVYNLGLQAPEADILKLGAGIGAQLSEYLELRLDLDTQWSSNYSDYTMTGSLRYQF